MNRLSQAEERICDITQLEDRRRKEKKKGKESSHEFLTMSAPSSEIAFVSWDFQDSREREETII
jgi:hypothetical protein